MLKDKIKKIRQSFFIPNIVYVLVLALVVRLLTSPFGTLQLDQGTFIAWSTSLARDGLKNFYNGWSDYLPGYLYVLWLLGEVKGIIPDVLLYKLPAILADLVTGYLIYRILKGRKGLPAGRQGIIGASLYLFNPAVFANSSLWGQADSLTALFSLLSIFYFSKFYLLSSIFLSIGTLIKPQAAFIVPVILFLMIKNKFNLFKIFNFGILGLGVFVIAFLPFWNHENLAIFIYERLTISLNQYPYTSVNAFNFWGLFGFWKPDNLYFQYAGYLLVLTGFIFLAKKLWQNKNAWIYLTAYIFGASFLFFTRMHERHMFPFFFPMALLSAINPTFLIPYIMSSLVYLANLYYSYSWITKSFISVFPELIIKFIIIGNVFSFFFLIYLILTKKKINLPKLKIVSTHVENFPIVSLSKRIQKCLLLLILTFAFASRVFALGSPDHEYFDEVYHAFTAKVMLGSDPSKAWEWWNTPPEGFAYEWTHPPLAKLGMALGMKIFGENSFGYRIPGAILGTLSVLMIFLIAKHLFQDDLLALISAFIFSLDGLALVMSRIGMNDSYLLFFVLLSIYLFLKDRDFFSALAFGLALSSKWSAIWAIPIFFILWIRRKHKFKISTFLFFLLLPITCYLLIYLPMFLTGHNLDIWWGMQKQMWWYHTGLVATHPYTSQWWSWPFLIRPIYLFTSDEVGGMVSRIYAFGNPLVFWFGLASVVISAIYAFYEKNKNLALVVFGYLIFFVPWAASPRIMFLYHYLPSIPFMAIATGYVLRRNPKLIIYFLVSSALLFLYFYPHWAGLSIPLWLDKSYYWISSWR